MIHVGLRAPMQQRDVVLLQVQAILLRVQKGLVVPSRLSALERGDVLAQVPDDQLAVHAAAHKGAGLQRVPFQRRYVVGDSQQDLRDLQIVIEIMQLSLSL